MIELENGDQPIEIERDVPERHLCLHAFCLALLFRSAEASIPDPIFDFPDGLVHGLLCYRTRHLCNVG